MEGKFFNVAQNALQADFYQVCFLIEATYDGLPSPANFHSWGKEQHALGTMFGWRIQTHLQQLPKERMLPVVAHAGAQSRC